MPRSQPRPTQPTRARRASGWVPDQHGAWAMLILPLVVGMWLSGPTLVHLPLSLFWLLGYFAYYAGGRWLRSRRRRRELTPLVVYAAAAAPPGIVTILLAPQLVRWVPAFVPLVIASAWLTARGKDRSLTNDVVTVVAAGLMAPVAYDAGQGEDWTALWLATGVLTAYFLGTVFYVKTMIRERGRVGYVRASVGYHLAIVAVAGWLMATGWQTWATVAVWVVLAGRAALGPALSARRSRPLRPAVIGAGEIVASVVVTLVVVSGLP